MNGTWSYLTAHSGPAHWKLHYHDARGCRQSPINLNDTDIRLDNGLIRHDDLQISYDRHDCTKMENMGYTWKISAKDNCKSQITANYLHGTYVLHHVHAHWGTTSNNGSEHLVNGKGYAAEVHIVHYNAKYSSIEEAFKHSDGLAVLGVFLKESLTDNTALEQFCQYLTQVQHKGQYVPLPKGFNLRKFLPENRDFWTYHGSLTTPPCYECVAWTVFRTPLPISRRQLDYFRSLHATAEDVPVSESMRILNNVRPVQSLYNRPIRATFAMLIKPIRLPPINGAIHAENRDRKTDMTSSSSWH